MTTFNDMVYVNGGVPIMPTGNVSGNEFFVGSAITGKTDAANYGTSPKSPLATLDYAIGRCTASNGDVIHVLPGHTENLTVATSIAADVKGITIIGHGNGSLIPTFSTTAAAGSITISAADVTIKNIKLVANFATGTTAGITIPATGLGCTLDGIQFADTAATSEFLVHVSVAAAVTGLTIKNCTFTTLAGSLTNSILFAGATTDTTIDNCYFFVDSADSVIDHAAAAAVNMVVRNCVVINADTGAAGYCLQHHADGTGVAHDNRFAYNKVDAEISVGAKVWWFNNYASNTIAESGLLDPSTAHAIP